MKLYTLLFSLFLISTLLSTRANAQNSADSLLSDATISEVVTYAIAHQPYVQQSLVDEAITEQQIKSRLADWYPQVALNGAFQHNFQVQTSVIGGNPVKLGVDNVSYAQFTLKQNIFDSDLLLASRTKNLVRDQSKQTTTSSKIDVAAEASKAYYAVLGTIQQIRVSESDIDRLQRSLQDATNQYQAGIADKIDYKRTTIALNNAKAGLESNKAILEARLAYLKSVIGYPAEQSLTISYDSLQMERDIVLDTTQLPDYTNRIEYRLLESQRSLLKANVDYNRWAYLPTVALNGGYYLNYQNNVFGKLYSNNFPNSFGILSVSLPIFQGFKRVANVRTAELQLKRTDWDLLDLKNNVNNEYEQAMASYKSNYANYVSLKENVALAQEVYDVIQLQYKSGIKTYLEVITSETDLRGARINYTNALYQLLSSKIDVQKSLGQLNY